MKKEGWVSYFFTVLGVLIILSCSYVVFAYSQKVLLGTLDFLASSDSQKLAACGLDTPSQIFGIRNDLLTFILPLFTIGMPFVLVCLAMIMFIAGYYYHNAKFRTDTESVIGDAEREAVRKIAQRVALGKDKEL
ncbi:hypothetical protein HY990_02240 [Candidatus Micrarchaeota archaeon]|nr:hypothetical protein [Candidatus Micrarchaeota archaeon]